MTQDFELFDAADDLIRFGLSTIPNAEIPDFTHYLHTVLSDGTSDRELQEIWRNTQAEFFITGSGLRAFLARALEIAEMPRSSKPIA
ncbi:hypothetical protein [Rhizobium oryzicola]|uniref:CdiI immunity protein domain-containing protein n=1 Tax=Rhizobium oryzicola TaxID=1232668 RepID=A0ABT8T311_9HYPH|nr:hypothetical protein [Rhizobium oryzicola]MDO1585016.1 hypothetical protein [Rhizobium oryzicola]